MTIKNIHQARVDSVKNLSENSAEFVIKPLFYGYGNTLGNSLRRVLLSSIKGSAITAFSIEGSTHEYAPIAGIQEDVINIMLNLKNIRIHKDGDEPVEMSLEIKGDQQSEKNGEKRVIAGDIKLPAGVTIANPNQIICHIDDPNFVLKMNFVVESGRGYHTIEKSSAERVHGDMIALDAVFTPVLRVRYKVENTRVGQDTNLQQLTMTVDTDGTMTPSDAFEEAAAILVGQYEALAGGTKVVTVKAPDTKEDSEDDDLGQPVEELGLSQRTTNALINNGVKTLKQLIDTSQDQLKEFKGFGQKAYDEIQELAASLDFVSKRKTIQNKSNLKKEDA